jgi:hypothetical protein
MPKQEGRNMIMVITPTKKQAGQWQRVAQATAPAPARTER